MNKERTIGPSALLGRLNSRYKMAPCGKLAWAWLLKAAGSQTAAQNIAFVLLLSICGMKDINDNLYHYRHAL